MKIEDQIARIEKKLSRFSDLIEIPNVFGADKHHFKLNPTKTESDIVEFEIEHGINLPLGYRNFLKKIGNGGVGPHYGLEPLENGRFIDLDQKDKNNLIDLSKPFLYNEPWNLDWEIPKNVLNEDEYLNDLYLESNKKHHINGLLRLSNMGCGVWINLVVNGEEYGNIWIDDICNDQGLAPLQTKHKNRVNFIDWYEEWLNSIRNAHLGIRAKKLKSIFKKW